MTVQAIGIDIGGSSIKAALVDHRGSVEGLIQHPTPQTGRGVADRCAYMASELVSSDVVGVGVGSAGLVDSANRVHMWGPHVAGPAPIGPAVEAATGLSVILDNDANAAAFAEVRLGAAKGFDNVLMVMLGTGIGGGIVIDGEIYRGSGFAGEIGHLTLDPDGPPCACGRDGCWETLVSGSVLDAAALQLAATDSKGAVASAAAHRRPTGQHLMVAAEAGDPGAMEAWSAAGTWLGRGVAQLAAVLDPDLVVVGGGPSRAGDLLLGPARTALAHSIYGDNVRQHFSMVASRFGQNGVVIGAGLQALEMIDG